MKRTSKREREILSWFAQGKTAKEIGVILGVSNRTVEWYLCRLRSKYDAMNITQLVANAVKAGVIGAMAIRLSEFATHKMIEWSSFIGDPGGWV